ncbi:hypothetical protein [Hylemonella gracilis]|uniref:Uncharacterized protein n=1 Tax=Hylemonella gracilis ATCC 19624 TaxID=887062 RepID=F3KQ76_9BURK|nr:hypothetical protein [Hylemonella gracilis]EGI78043.1 hypothetical protein HGR_02952 [Hylemonella gracilis ATCC 19624]
MVGAFFTGTALGAAVLAFVGDLARGAGFGEVLEAVLATALPVTGLADVVAFLETVLTGALETAAVLDLAGDFTALAGTGVFLTTGFAAALTAALEGTAFLLAVFFAPAAARVWDAAAPALPRGGLPGGLAFEGDDVLIDLAGLAFT